MDWKFTQARQRYSAIRTREDKKEVTIDNIKIEVIQKRESARYLGQK